jgi:hypothetical protein
VRARAGAMREGHALGRRPQEGAYESASGRGAGAAYSSPFVGRIDDTRQEGLGRVDPIVKNYDNDDKVLQRDAAERSAVSAGRRGGEVGEARSGERCP